MSSVLANILKINGQVVTRARLRALADRAARAKDKKFTGKLKRAIAAMDKAGVRSARINFDNALIDQTFMPDSVKISELEGLYGIEVHGADLGEAKGGNTFFSEVSRRILAKIKEGTLPWRQPWSEKLIFEDFDNLELTNYVSGKPYRGANFFNCLLFGDGATEFITEKQAEERGGRIVNHKAYIPICYFVRSKVVTPVKVKDQSGNEQIVNIEDVLMGLKWYRVYPLSATADVKPIIRKNEKPEVKPKEKPKGLEFSPIKAAEQIINAYPKPPTIKHEGKDAVYSAARDLVKMPPKTAFNGVPEYYCTLFHELIHSTGHPNRLDRLVPANFGTKPYAAEELVAELGASFLCAICRIDYFTLDNSAAYLKNWSTKLENEIQKDKSFFVRQQFASLRAVRYMMGPLWKTWNKSLKIEKPAKEKSATTKASKPKTASKPATPKPAPKPTEPAKIKGLPVGFKGAFYGWGFTIQVQLEIDNQVVLEIWENGGNVTARIHGRNPIERETAQHNIWQRVVKHNDGERISEGLKKDMQKRIKLFVEALYKDAQQENRRRAKLGSAKAAPVKTNKAVLAKYAAIIGKSQPARRVKKKGSLNGADQDLDGLSEDAKDALLHFKNTLAGKKVRNDHHEIIKKRSLGSVCNRPQHSLRENLPDSRLVSNEQNPSQKSNGLRIVKAEELAGIQIETLKLQGVWGKWLGQPATNFDLLLSGSPGGGKSTLLLQFAHYLANDLKKRVLFVSREEFGSATLAEKVQRLKIKNVHFTNTITSDARLQGDYDVVFIDSITDMRWSVDLYKRLREFNPEVAFLLVAQQTKGGKFKGNNEWPHETEIVAEVADGEAWCTKNRYSLNKQPILIPGYVQ